MAIVRYDESNFEPEGKQELGAGGTERFTMESRLKCRCGHTREEHIEGRPFSCTLCDDNTCHGFSLDPYEFEACHCDYSVPMFGGFCSQCGKSRPPAAPEAPVGEAPEVVAEGADAFQAGWNKYNAKHVAGGWERVAYTCGFGDGFSVGAASSSRSTPQGMCDSCGNIPFSKSPVCAHSEQFLYTLDGGKHIVCLLCEHEKRKRGKQPVPARAESEGTMYKISDEQFLNELEINAFISQISGYPIGHRRRTLDFKPIVVTEQTREETLKLPYTFTDEQKAALLEKE